MFTGLIDDVGTIERVTATEAGRDVRVRCRYDDLADGESVALNGACLTVRQRGRGWFTVAAVETTLARTNIGTWREGTRVNLERALRMGDRLGGHLVQGHVDGLGDVAWVGWSANSLLIDVRLPEPLAELVVPHGSVALDGVSLTVNALAAHGVVQVSLVEYTLRHTTLGALAVGDRVHVEGDVIAKYVHRLLEPYRGQSAVGTRDSTRPQLESPIPNPDCR